MLIQNYLNRGLADEVRKLKNDAAGHRFIMETFPHPPFPKTFCFVPRLLYNPPMLKRLLITSIIILAVVLSSFAPTTAAESGRVTPDELKAMLAKKERVILIDVRTPAEHNEAHIPGSVLMPLDTLEGVTNLPNGGAIIFYCRSGKRSQTALDILSRKGFKDIRHLDGGINAWIKSGGEVISGTAR